MLTPTAFERFRALVDSDAALAASLESIGDRNEFVQRTVALAAQNGLTIRAEEVHAAIGEGRTRWLSALNG